MFETTITRVAHTNETEWLNIGVVRERGGVGSRVLWPYGAILSFERNDGCTLILSCGEWCGLVDSPNYIY